MFSTTGKDICHEEKQITIASSLEELSELTSIDSIDDIDVYVQRFKEGDTLYYLADKSRIIARGWLKENTDSFYVWETACSIHFDNKVSVLYDFYVVPGYRKRGLYKKLLIGIVGNHNDKDILVIYALNSNKISLHTIEKCGFKKIGTFCFFSRRIKV